MYRDDKIRAAMGAKDWDLQTLAQKSGVGAQTIALIRKGETDPRVGTLKKIADALEIPMSELFAERNGSAAQETGS